MRSIAECVADRTDQGILDDGMMLKGFHYLLHAQQISGQANCFEWIADRLQDPLSPLPRKIIIRYFTLHMADFIPAVLVVCRLCMLEFSEPQAFTMALQR